MKPTADESRDKLRAALAAGPGTQKALADRTGLQARTVSNLLRAMADRSEVYVLEEARGRAPRVWAAGAPPLPDDDAAAEARDLEASRAWLKAWQPRRCPLQAMLFGQVARPMAVAACENAATAEQARASSYKNGSKNAV